MFALLYGGSLCVIGGLALVVVAWMARAERRKQVGRIDALRSAGMAAIDSVVATHNIERATHAAELNVWRDRYKRVAGRCRELERELTEIKLGTATAGYTFDQVPARTIPARVRMVKAR